MSQCEKIIENKRKSGGSLHRCDEEASGELRDADGCLKNFCHFHLRFEGSKPRPKVNTRLTPHREFVMGLPMPGFEALKELAREVGL